MADAEATIKLLQPIEYRQPTDLGGYIVELRDAGHVLGSAAVSVTETASKRTLVFTGDVGRPNSPVVQNPDPFTHAHALISECTYGGKIHPPIAAVPGLVAAIINETVAKGGLVIMPAFALGRTQAIVQQLHLLFDQHKIANWLQVYIDSPLANRVTEVFRHFPNLMDDETTALIKPFDDPHVHYVANPDESRKLNDQQKSAIIIASSGMCEAGRILHHLKHHIRDPRTTVLLPGFQAENTLGRKIQDHWKEVPILGDKIPLHARVEMISGLSAHGDSKELTDYVRPLLGQDPPKVYLVHGEIPQANAHQLTLEQAGFKNVSIPSRGDSAEV
jgi:metallo-beta-lactamase family protein